jgi:Protein of unknown function (DUF3102)
MVATCRSAKTGKSDDREPSPSRRRASDKSRVQAPVGRPSHEAAQPERILISTAAVVPCDRLEDLAAEIKAKRDQLVGGLRRSLALAIELGGLLLQVKKQLPHGRFQRWIQDNCDFSYESAAAYARLHEHRERLGQIDSKMQSIADLTVSEALHVLAKPRAEFRDKETETPTRTTVSADGFFKWPLVLSCELFGTVSLELSGTIGRQGTDKQNLRWRAAHSRIDAVRIAPRNCAPLESNRHSEL